MSTPTQHNRIPSLRLLAAATALALALPATALAQSEREAELEQRVAELERMVRSLIEQQASQPEPVPAPQPEVANPVQRTNIVGASPPGTTFGYGGFIKANSTVSNYTDGNPAPGSVGRDFYLPGAIPVAGVGPVADPGSGPVYDAHAKQSRFWLTTDTVLESGDRLGTRFEMDFAVPAGGDERNTNTYTPVIRRAYFTFNNWLFGQEWSNFMELGALPESTDFLGPTEGMVFVRQAQVRYTNGPWSVAIENPETTLVPFGGGARIVTDQNQIPDLTVRYRHTADWGLLAVSGVARQLRRDVPGQSSSDEFGYGLNVTSRINFGANDLRLMATYGSGIGRYLGLNYFEDGVLDASGRIDALDVFATYLAYRHVWTGTWRSNFILGYTSADNPATLTGPGANAKASSFRVNLMWSPVPRLDFGVEASHAVREVEDGRRGELSRLDFMGRYSF